MSWWNPFSWGRMADDVGAAPEAPPVALQAKPIAVNAPVNARTSRDCGRLVQLYHALEAEPGRADVLDEIARRRSNLVAAGWPAPRNADDAAALLTVMQGDTDAYHP